MSRRRGRLGERSSRRKGITRHLAAWAIRSAEDRVLEPSTGEAALLISAVERLTELGNNAPAVDGVEIHPPSAEAARALISAVGGTATIADRTGLLRRSPSGPTSMTV